MLEFAPCTNILRQDNPDFMREMIRTRQWWSLIWLWLRLKFGRLPEFQIKWLGSAPKVICGEQVNFFNRGVCSARFVKVVRGSAVIVVSNDDLSGEFVVVFPFPSSPHEVILRPMGET